MGNLKLVCHCWMDGCHGGNGCICECAQCAEYIRFKQDGFQRLSVEEVAACASLMIRRVLEKNARETGLTVNEVGRAVIDCIDELDKYGPANELSRHTAEMIEQVRELYSD